jgi:hypothetical protein
LRDVPVGGRMTDEPATLQGAQEIKA